ncbi:MULTISPECIES: DUF6814 family protein [Olivibacter]|jgi:hypothetical protein|uniref:DUF6814 family protein n=2 Tax=Olivibacter TaxID=376469 RepID=A0ABV6HQ15_9SPHI|nr:MULTISPECIES: hypothetical protein [Olivibacter]MCL4641325.1 hypothetical protein [Olivibacter sp. UJ_SKK_5.1]MDM8173878.1 hypothetical protein [Olivibacter sp. 47]MDX3915062.1 hypothetical protein [Pseudosphingobacterium sp.]QEL03667.1 hypothetical protein FKG96_23470 [Olivibacter sp. LS-1]
MRYIKKYLGVLWIVLAVVSGYYLIVSQAIPQFQSEKPEDLVPAIVYTFVLMPIISGGLLVFGWYALLGEYDD